jgi:hypothetical protein
LANGVSRFSSWRYNLPVDWVIYFYFSVGAAEALGSIAILFGAKIEKIFPTYIPQSTRNSLALRVFHPQFGLIVLAFMFVGTLPWFVKELTQPRYTASQNQLISKLELSGLEANDIQSFLSQPNSVLVEGRLLYPRLYRRTEGLSSANPWAAYAVKDYARIGFLLINDARYDMIFPTKDALDFSQGADAIVLACQREKYLEVRVIDFGDKNFQSAPLSQACN